MHALVTTLLQEPKLIRPFLRWAGVRKPPLLKQIHLVEQQVPGIAVSGEVSDEKKGLPDACFYTNDGWSLLIEAKVQARASKDQLVRHRRTAKRQGFEDTQVVLLGVTEPQWSLPTWAGVRKWQGLYLWLSKPKHHSMPWVRTLIEYFEIFESKMSAKGYNIEGAVTVFSGIPFDNDQPYTYHQAKRLIRMLGNELRKTKRLHKIGLDPHGQGRKAITGKDRDGVWDLIPLKSARDHKSHTSSPHFTMNLTENHVGAATTIPNSVKGGFRTRLKEIGCEGFCDYIFKIERRLRPLMAQVEGASTKIYLIQRHYKSQRSVASIDGKMEADLRTLVKGAAGGVKFQPQWIEAIYELAINKRSNMQLGIASHLPTGTKLVQSKEIVNLIADIWIAQSPILELAAPV